MANINKIKLSGTSYDIQDSNAARSITLTQAEYDALQNKDPNVFYIISDSTLNYVTSAETESAITQSVSGKADTSAVTSVSDSLTAHTANTTVHVTAQDKTNWNNKSDFSGDYDDLTNKPTIPTVPTNVSDFTNDAGYITSDDISGKTNQSDFTAHTANTTVHVTASEKSTWNSKSDFSGNYNDLSNKPTIPSKTSDLTNDSNFATTGDVQTATNDMATKTWVGQQGYLTQHQDISGKQDVSGMTAYTTTATTSALNDVVTAHTANTSIHVSAEQIAAWNAKSDFSGSYNDLTNKLSAGTNVSIVDNVISAEGGGKAIVAGTGIAITTGETADTINCTLNISNGTGGMSIKSLGATSASANHTAAFGQNTKATSICAFAEGWGTTASGGKSHSEGDQTVAKGGQSHAEGSLTKAIADHSHSEGYASSATSRVTTMVGITTPYGWNTRHSEGYATVADNGCTHTEGLSTKALNVAEHSSGAYNVSYTASTTWGDSGNTLFSVGNGTSSSARHNAFEIRQNGDIYLTLNGQDVKLQDQLGGGGSSYSAGTGIDITNDVISVTGKVDTTDFNTYSGSVESRLTEDEEVTAAALNNINDRLSEDEEVTAAALNVLDDKIDAVSGDVITISGAIPTTTSAVTSGSTAALTSGGAYTQFGGLKLQQITQSSYDSLVTKDPSTLYIIVN